MSFAGSQPTLVEAKVAKNYLNEKQLRAMGQIVSEYLDFGARAAQDHAGLAAHLDRMLTMSGEQLLLDARSISHGLLLLFVSIRHDLHKYFRCCFVISRYYADTQQSYPASTLFVL